MHGYFTVKKLCELWNNNKKKKSRTFSLEYNDWNVYKISCSTELFSFRMKKSVDSSFFWIGEFIVRQVVPLCSGMLNKLITNPVSSVSALLKKNWPKWNFFFFFPQLLNTAVRGLSTSTLLRSCTSKLQKFFLGFWNEEAIIFVGLDRNKKPTGRKCSFLYSIHRLFRVLITDSCWRNLNLSGALVLLLGNFDPR